MRRSNEMASLLILKEIICNITSQKTLIYAKANFNLHKNLFYFSFFYSSYG